MQGETLMRSRDIFEHQVRSLVSLVQRCKASGRADIALEKRLKVFVSMELLGRGNADVIARALGELEDAEADLLQDMVSLCSQSFDRGDEMWNAFAVPIATHWHMKQERFYVGRRGQGTHLSELAAGIRQCTGAERVVLDNAIYSAKALFGMSAYELHDHLQSLLLSSPRFAKAPATMALRSTSEPPWRMAFFLGVEVTKPGGKRQLNDPGVQDALQSYLHWGVDALTKPALQEPSVATSGSKFDQGAYGATICHAPLYLFDAIQFSEMAMRGYRLRHMLEELAKEEKQGTLFYAFNPLCFALDLLLQGRWLAFEMRWDLFGAITVEDFLVEVRRTTEAANIRLRCKLVELECNELQDMIKRTALGQCKFRRM